MQKMTQTRKKEFRFSICSVIAIIIEKQKMKLRKDTLSYLYYSEQIDKITTQWKLSDDKKEYIEDVINPDEVLLNHLLEASITDILKDRPEDQQLVDYIQSILEKLLTVMVLRHPNEKYTTYDARLRKIFKEFAHLLLATSEDKRKTSIGLLVTTAESNMILHYVDSTKGKDILDDGEEEVDKVKRWAGVGIATLTGGVLIGVTGGLAAPFLAAGLGSITASLGLAGAAGAIGALGSVTGAAVVGTLFGISGAGLAGYKINRHYKDLDEFYFTPLKPTSSFSYTIAISGWLPELDSALNQWQIVQDLNPLQETLVLHYERQNLVELTTAVRKFLTSKAISYTGYTAAALTSTATMSILSALTLPVGLMNAVNLLDNPWNIALSKSEQAGVLLARQVLGTFVGGRRPVTLIGHGMGARAIVYCLLELLKMCETGLDLFGIVDSVYLFGCCMSISTEQWVNIRTLVTDRFVNCYSENDWVLKIIFRLHPNKAAGSDKIDVKDIENFDLSDIIPSHESYFECADEIFRKVGYCGMVNEESTIHLTND